MSSARNLCAIIMALVLMTAGAAEAHKLKVFATGDGRKITGYAYFPGGGRAQDLVVTALAPDGFALGEAITNAEGEFSIAVRYRCDHRLVVQTQDGHKAVFVVGASELATDLPPLGTGAGNVLASEQAVAPEGRMAAGETAGAEDSVDAPPGTSDRDMLQSAVAEAVREQVRPLREQLESYEERVRLHDVLGGIGYVFGIGGVAFYFLGIRRRESGSVRNTGD